MKFSIIIPLYNKAAYIRLTLSSVLAQTYRDFEVIVIDDGSSDGSADIVSVYADTHTDLQLRLIQQANAGVAAARNHGIELARGEWICFLDADDWLHPEYLSGLAKTALAYPQVSAVAARLKAIPDNLDWQPSAWPLAPASYELISDLPTRWMQGIPFFTGSIAIKKTLLENMQPCFPVSESFGEDLDLWFRIAEKTPIALLENPLTAYRTAVSGSLTSAHGLGHAAPFLKRMHLRATTLPRRDPQRGSMLAFVAHQYITQARFAAADGHRLRALQLLMQTSATGWDIKRWWSTLLMALLLPGQWIYRWQNWREQRRAI